MMNRFPFATHRQPRKTKGQDHFASSDKGSFVKGEWKSKTTAFRFQNKSYFKKNLVAYSSVFYAENVTIDMLIVTLKM